MKKIIFITILAFSFVTMHAQNSRSVDKNLQRSSTTFPAQLEIDSDPSQPDDDVGIQNLDPNYGSNIYLQNDAGSIGNLFLEGSAGPFFGANSLSLICDSDIFIAPNNSISMTLDATGNVGIGTTTPTSLLDVAGEIKATTAAEATGLNLSETNSYADMRVIQNTKSTVDNHLYLGLESGPSSELHMYSNNLETITAVNGRVGINNTTPGSLMLSVEQLGSFGFDIKNSGADRAYEFWVSSGSTGQLNLASNGSNVGNFNATSGVYTSTSDRRLKKNIQKMEPILDKVNQLEASRYTYKKDANNREYLGFIAQDVEAIFPELVHVSNDERNDGLYTLNYSGFGIVAIKAVQELSAENEELKKDNKEMKERISALEAAVEALIKE